MARSPSSQHQSVRLAYVTLAAASRADLLALAGRYRSEAAVERAFQEAELATQSWLSGHEIGAPELQAILRILSALIYPNRPTRAAPEIIAANQLGQAGLWRFGISGDYPLPPGRSAHPRRGRTWSVKRCGHTTICAAAA